MLKEHPPVLKHGLPSLLLHHTLKPLPHPSLFAQVLEYSELDPATASAADPATGQLYYNWSNICMHYFDVAWLQVGQGACARGLNTQTAMWSPHFYAHGRINKLKGAGCKLAPVLCGQPTAAPATCN